MSTFSTNNPDETHCCQNSEAIYDCYAAELTETLIRQGHKGSPLPATETTNPAEQNIRQHAEHCTEEEYQRLQTEHGDPVRCIRETIIDPDLPSSKCNAMVTNLRDYWHTAVEECREARQEVADADADITAYLLANNINRPIQQGSFRNALLLTLLCIVLEAIFNGHQLFEAGQLQGGLLGATAIALLVSMVNALCGALTGAVLVRHANPANNSRWRTTAIYGLVITGLFVLGCNLAFAYMRAFQGIDLTTLNFAIIDSPTLLRFLAVFGIGCIIYLFMALKWGKVYDPLIRYQTLGENHNIKSEKFRQIRNEKQQLMQSCRDDYCAQIDALQVTERSDYADMEQSLRLCRKLERSYEMTAQNIAAAHCASISMHRERLRSCGLKKLPDYIHDEAVIVLSKSPFNTAQLEHYVGQQYDNLQQQENCSKAAKNQICAIAEQALQAIQEACRYDTTFQPESPELCSDNDSSDLAVAAITDSLRIPPHGGTQ